MDVAADPQYMRKVNAAAILSTLRTRQAMSVSALAAAVGLSRQAVTRSLGMLAGSGLVEFSAPSMNEAGVGRPAQLVRFRAEAGHVLGIDINPQQIRAAVADLSGTIVGSRQLRLHGSSAKQALLGEIDALLAATTVARASVWFASVGIPGIIDPAARSIRLIPSMPELAGDWLARTLRDHLGCPVYLDNDIKLATQGERRGGAERDAESFVFVYWGERVGAGIVLQGHLHRGASNDAGDIGFLDLALDAACAEPVDARPRPGGLGRFEGWVGADEIVRLAMAAARDTSDERLLSALSQVEDSALEVVVDQALAANPAALRAVDEVADRFALGIVAIRAILDPDAIVIGGPMARLGDVLLSALRSRLDRQPLNQPRIDVSSLGDDAVIEGAVRHSLWELPGVAR